YNNIGTLYRQLGEIDAARPYIDQACELFDSGAYELFSGVLNSLAWFLYEHAEPARLSYALSVAERALLASKKGPEQLGILDTKARILLKLEREAEAREIAALALAQDWNHKDFQDLKTRFGFTPETLEQALPGDTRAYSGALQRFLDWIEGELPPREKLVA